MKVHAGLELESGLGSLRTLVRELCTLPDDLRATRHSQGEDEAGEAIDQVERYLESLKGGASPSRQRRYLRHLGANAEKRSTHYL